MARVIPDRWLSAESVAFDKLFGLTSRCFETVERLTALNLQGDPVHQTRIAWLQGVAQRLQDTVALYAALGGRWDSGK